MKILFIISIAIIVFAVVNYEKMSYKAWYYRNKEQDDGYYWGGVPRKQAHPTEKGCGENA